MPVEFLDGPAKGEVMWLLNLCPILRVVKKGDSFDALDDPKDKLPKPPFEIYAYVAKEYPHFRHVKNGSYAHANYSLCSPQPIREVMLNNEGWYIWQDNYPKPLEPKFHPMTGRRLN